MNIKVLTTIISKRYVEKVGKYIVEIGILNEPKSIIWLTEKQMINLINSFNSTPKGYSNSDVFVVGVFNDNRYFCYSKAIKHKKERVFTVPKEYDLRELIDD
ncbi:hypothetical protein IAI10_16470 [Clostridium sp. 19966]|uniref:hypothetical protein n=1 Tax=Clostridium sp. 19966 TaxID=2768166 RepID=UPI0028DD8982|nr:hypothetical protein [Clostridium sp. 19966]MDT8718263.1 hypothetical protein [Clostridium sp. 19966]